ncbi:MAG TPA: DUF4405 domain-containing protein [Candidatus Hydrogenedentes bacterium]|nr:DUF4405 domain-containing protein [Candidatus Hydrogenedentota bacterium]
MSKPVTNFVVDAVALAALMFLAATGILLRYVLPPGSGHFSALWGMDRHEWGQIHFWIAVVLVGLLALHLVLHCRWVVCMVKGHPREGSRLRVAFAVIGVLTIAGLSAAPFLGQVVQTSAGPQHKMRLGKHSRGPAHQFNGSITLREVEQRTGVSVNIVLRELGLPPDVPTSEQLGRLRKRYGFDMREVREIVQENLPQR